jgi:hypothetical protein
MRDFEAYWSAGATWNAGLVPYERAIWGAESRLPDVDAARDELLPFVGPAAFRPLYASLARLPFLSAVHVWAVLLGLAFVTLLGAGLALARGAPRTALTVVATLVLGLAFGPIIATFALGQAALPAAAAVAATALLVEAIPLAAIVTAFVAALQPNIALALIPLAFSRRGALVLGAAFALFALATLAFGGGVPGLHAYLQMLGAHGDAERFIIIQTTPTAIAYAAGASAATARAVGTVVACIALACAIGGCIALRRDRVLAVAFACAMVPLVVPFFHEHDLALVLLPILVLAIRARGPLAACAALATVTVGIDWLGFVQRENAHGQILALGTAVALAYAALAREPQLRYRLAGLAAVALGAVLVPLVSAHPAPTWPDALGAFHAPVAASAAAVWGMEQHVSGLDARDGVWALMRAFTLLGALALAGVVYFSGRRRNVAITNAEQAA